MVLQFCVQDLCKEQVISQEGIGGKWIFLKTFTIGLPIIILNALLFAAAKYITSSNISYYFKGYTLTIILDTNAKTIEESVNTILEFLRARGEKVPARVN